MGRVHFPRTFSRHTSCLIQDERPFRATDHARRNSPRPSLQFPSECIWCPRRSPPRRPRSADEAAPPLRLATMKTRSQARRRDACMAVAESPGLPCDRGRDTRMASSPASRPASNPASGPASNPASNPASRPVDRTSRGKRPNDPPGSAVSRTRTSATAVNQAPRSLQPSCSQATELAIEALRSFCAFRGEEQQRRAGVASENRPTTWRQWQAGCVPASFASAIRSSAVLAVPSSRTSSVLWILEAAVHFDCHMSVATHAVYYLDRLMPIRSRSLMARDHRLHAAVCLLLASKMLDPDAPSASHIADFARYGLTEEEILDLEPRVLPDLDFDLNVRAPQDVLAQILAIKLGVPLEDIACGDTSSAFPVLAVPKATGREQRDNDGLRRLDHFVQVAGAFSTLSLLCSVHLDEYGIGEVTAACVVLTILLIRQYWQDDPIRDGIESNLDPWMPLFDECGLNFNRVSAVCLLLLESFRSFLQTARGGQQGPEAELATDLFEILRDHAPWEASSPLRALMFNSRMSLADMQAKIGGAGRANLEAECGDADERSIEKRIFQNGTTPFNRLHSVQMTCLRMVIDLGQAGYAMQADDDCTVTDEEDCESAASRTWPLNAPPRHEAGSCGPAHASHTWANGDDVSETSIVRLVSQALGKPRLGAVPTPSTVHAKGCGMSETSTESVVSIFEAPLSPKLQRRRRIRAIPPKVRQYDCASAERSRSPVRARARCREPYLRGMVTRSQSRQRASAR